MDPKKELHNLRYSCLDRDRLEKRKEKKEKENKRPRAPLGPRWRGDGPPLLRGAGARSC
jgi:hypothetical protein